jgi:streptogramin lyase
VLLALIALLVSQQAATPKKRPAIPQKPGVPGVQKPITGITPDAVFNVEGVPDWLVIIEDAVFVSNKPKNNIARLNIKTNKVETLIPVGAKPCSGLAAGFGSVWVPNCGDQTLSRVDFKANKVVATLPYGPADTEGGIATSPDSVWMVTGAEGKRLLRIDPDTNQVVAEIPLPEGSYTPAYGEGALWVTSTKTHVVSRVDPKSNLVTDTIEVDPEPRFIAVGEGFVWTLNQKKGNVSKIDPKLRKVVATIEVGVPGGGGDISAGDGSVWVTAFTIPLSRIDPETNRVTHQFVGEGGDAVRVGHKSVWLSNLRAQNVWRLKPAKAGGKDLDE